MQRKLQASLLILVVLGVVAISGCTSTDNSSNSTSNNVTAVINYSGSWSGAISDNTGTRSISGDGNQTIQLGSDPGVISINAQKQDGGDGTLTVSIIKGGKTLATQSTNSAYGVASTTATP